MTAQRGNWRTRLRRLSMGAATLLGRPKGFFIPYRYAASAAPPAGYAAIAAHFQVAEPVFQAVLNAIADLAAPLAAIPADAPAPSPRWGQGWFPGLDAAALYAVTRTRRPARIIEVGSGHSTRFAARAIADGGLSTTQICIDPAPRAALEGLSIDWRRKLLSIEDLPLFEALSPGDIAFFDSSHILMPGTDVDLIMNEILPRLLPGVLVHIHDVFLPDPYPESWAWRGYNEQNALGPMLAGGGFAPIFASAYVRRHMAADPAVAAHPPWRGAPESSLWLERLSNGYV